MITGNNNNYHYIGKDTSRFNTFNELKTFYKPLDKFNTNITYQKPNINIITNLPSQQERVINFGQDGNENNFKKTLRQNPTILKNNSINIINNFNQYNSGYNYYNRNDNIKNKKVDNIITYEEIQNAMKLYLNYKVDSNELTLAKFVHSYADINENGQVTIDDFILFAQQHSNFCNHYNDEEDFF